MIRLSFLFVALAFLLVACDQDSERSIVVTAAKRGAPPMGAVEALDGGAPPAAAPSPQSPNAPRLAYTHSLSLEMAADKVQPRFERARDLCLSTQAMHCSLVHASIRLGNARTSAPPSAYLSVRLPHDQIVGFETNLLSPLPDEANGQPILRSSTTDADDLTFAIEDGDRRLKQAEDYRDRLTALAQRGGAKVGDLIQIEQKLSEVQSRIEALSAQQRQLNLRVDTEVLNVDLSATPTFASARSPLARAWANAGEVLGRSAANAFTFVISALPWIPLVALGLWILTWLWRLVRGKGWRWWRRPNTPGS